MNKLIINTANDVLEIVLMFQNNVFFKIEKSKLHHNETLIPLLDELLKENQCQLKDIDEFGVIVGPGSFTGIRVGIATIKAFRDSLNIKARGINNLDYLFNLAKSQNKDIDIVAIKGSKDSYFVARFINGVIYKYERNLSLDDLKTISKDSPVGMFVADENLNSFVPKFDANVLVECLDNSNDSNLLPIYYQLSQAENEKLKRKNLAICDANKTDLKVIAKIETESINYNRLDLDDFESMFNNDAYIIKIAKLDEEIVGFVLCQISDEINITSIAIKKEFRNLGIATKLFECVEKFAKAKGINCISLEVNSKNITAYLLYEKLGFTVRRIRKKYYSDGNDCLEMAKNLK